MAFAGEALTLEVSERGSLVLSAASVSAADGRANVQLRSLPASVMNYESHLQNCAASADEAKAAGAFDVVADACGVPIGSDHRRWPHAHLHLSPITYHLPPSTLTLTSHLSPLTPPQVRRAHRPSHL